ncbi:MAG TPA: dihydroneopterin aldolase [Acidiferrobacteraceae bacterium]|nr:dihydroneopterin aldolase [Acidiferrobacteraceae bacterium]
MDIIYLHGLKIDCVIGIWEWERRCKQSLTIDLDMAADIAKAAATDHIDDTLDYKTVAKRIVEFVGQSEFQLVETLGENIATVLRQEFDIPWCRVRINKKGAIRSARDVGVVVERGQQS